LSVSREADTGLVKVRNSGAPIPADALRTIFDRFVRADQSGKGSGLGLAIARSIVLAHGGSIAASSTGDATEFSITLPLADGQVGTRQAILPGVSAHPHQDKGDSI
jgi:signal transduction histidine kinase